MAINHKALGRKVLILSRTQHNEARVSSRKEETLPLVIRMVPPAVAGSEAG
ncbi:hypothetical protein KA025_02385 [Candidatus Saccharibacteria bacterium]|nr:hypothetical protein [Candidatus Saccharibacteria bacterium]MBP7834912.1 hypothetical protein [Candidatus Saccharibacteria bacterium]